jgi:Uma2 family endonuclease
MRHTRYILVDGGRIAVVRRVVMPAELERTRRLFTRKEYHRMGEAGILRPTERVELIRGEIVEMSPIGPRHIAFVNSLTELLIMRLGGRAVVSVQNPVALGEHSEPQPDLAVLRRRADYKHAEPATGDVLLLIEVADTSLAYDRRVKLRLYAESGIPEYWLIDASAETVEVHRRPRPDGYAETRQGSGDAAVAPEAFPDVSLRLAEIFA